MLFYLRRLALVAIFHWVIFGVPEWQCEGTIIASGPFGYWSLDWGAKRIGWTLEIWVNTYPPEPEPELDFPLPERS